MGAITGVPPSLITVTLALAPQRRLAQSTLLNKSRRLQQGAGSVQADFVINLPQHLAADEEHIQGVHNALLGTSSHSLLAALQAEVSAEASTFAHSIVSILGLNSFTVNGIAPEAVARPTVQPPSSFGEESPEATETNAMDAIPPEVLLTLFTSSTLLLLVALVDWCVRQGGYKRCTGRCSCMMGDNLAGGASPGGGGGDIHGLSPEEGSSVTEDVPGQHTAHSETSDGAGLHMEVDCGPSREVPRPAHDTPRAGSVALTEGSENDQSSRSDWNL
jgi:hypothetical protein